MKNLKNFIKLLPLLLLVVLVSCKKDNKKPDPDSASTHITTDELASQYLVLTLNTAPHLRILYFNKTEGAFNGEGISGTMDNLSGRRIQPVSVKDDSFTFDTDGNDKKVYTFKLAKDDAGKIKLSSYTYTNQDDPVAGLTSAFIFKVADAPDFFSRNLHAADNSTAFIKFSGDKWIVAQKPDFTGSITQGSFYKISPGAWKGNLIGINSMGVSVPATDNAPAMMGVEFDGSTEVAAFVPY